MVDFKTSQENPAGPAQDANLFRGVQNGGNVKFSFAQVKAYIQSWINFSDLNGSLSGDVSTSGTTATIGTHAVANSKMAQAAAATLKGNPTNALADVQDFTIQGLVTLASPDASNDYLLIYDHTAAVHKKVTPAVIAGSNTAGVSSLNSGTGALAISGASLSGSTIYAPQSGFSNRLRNSSLTSWFRGSASRSITTAGGWGAEGIFIVPTGASVASQQSVSGLSSPLSYYSQLITGATSVTDLVVRFVISSLDAAPLAGKQVTFQVPVLNNTGGTITPIITVKRATAQDSTYSSTDVSAVNLQSITNGSTGVLAYSWAAPSGSNLGLSIDIDFGNNFSTNGKSIQIGGGFDCRVTPGVSTGTVSGPPVPEIQPAALDIAWNKLFYETSYDNGTAPGTATHAGICRAGMNVSANDAGGVNFATKFKTPSLSYWDGAGSANVFSSNAAGSWTDGRGGISAISGAIGLNSAAFNLGNTAQGTSASSAFVHFAADAALVGA